MHKVSTVILTDQFKHEVNSYMRGQADKLLVHQAGIASANYAYRTGTLSRALDAPAVTAGSIFGGISVEVAYPIHIRFLDMKKGRGGKRKRNYVPIYNKYVYGYLKSDIYKRLNELIPEQMILAFDKTFKAVK